MPLLSFWFGSPYVFVWSFCCLCAGDRGGLCIWRAPAGTGKAEPYSHATDHELCRGPDAGDCLLPPGAARHSYPGGGGCAGGAGGLVADGGPVADVRAAAGVSVSPARA